MDIIKAAKKTIYQHKLLRKGDTLIVGVSGGADSIALAYVLADLRFSLGVKIHIAHINHQLRKNSLADQKFVEKLAKKLAIPFTAVTVKVKRVKGKTSVEELARDKRLNALISLAKRKRADAIVLAHHRDDLAETVLMRILRGSGLLGLEAMAPKREYQGHVILRPFLEVSRRDIETYLKKKKLKFRQDPTNRHTKFLRNKIRLQLLPYLEREVHPNLKKVLADLSQSSGTDYAYLTQQAQKAFVRTVHTPSRGQILIRLPSYRQLHPSIQRLIIRFSFANLKGNMNTMEMTHLKELEDLIQNRPVGSAVHLPSRISATKEKSNLRLSLRKS